MAESLLNHFRYHRLAGYYVRLFGTANVLVRPYELFTSTPQDFVRQIIDFCELEISEEALNKLPYTKRENPALSSFSVFIKRRTNILFTQRGHLNPWVLYPIISRKKSKHLFYALDRVLPQKIKRMFDQASHETIAAIAGDRYRESNSGSLRFSRESPASHGVVVDVFFAQRPIYTSIDNRNSGRRITFLDSR